MSNALSFEAAMKRLEEIVQFLERGNIPLEEAVQAYEEGMQLKQYCMERLEQAQLRIEKVTGAPKKEPETVE
jgi:exodeoxyribonuclease VII small subunit